MQIQPNNENPIPYRSVSLLHIKMACTAYKYNQQSKYKTNLQRYAYIDENSYNMQLVTNYKQIKNKIQKQKQNINST